MKPTRCASTSTAKGPARLGPRSLKHDRRSTSRISPSREMRSRRFWSASRRNRQPEWRRRPGLRSRLPIRPAALRWLPNRLRWLPPAPLPQARGGLFPVPRWPRPRRRLQPRLFPPRPLPSAPPRPVPPPPLPMLPRPGGLFPFRGRQRPTLWSRRRLPAGPWPGLWWQSHPWPRRPLRRLPRPRPSRSSSSLRLRRPTLPRPLPPWNLLKRNLRRPRRENLLPRPPRQFLPGRRRHSGVW